MKREQIKKVVRHGVEMGIISSKDFSIPEEERIEEIVTIIQNNIEEEKGKTIAALRYELGEFIRGIGNDTKQDDVTDESRSLTLGETINIILHEYWTTQGLIDEILSE